MQVAPKLVVLNGDAFSPNLARFHHNRLIKMRASAISALACFVAFTAAQTFQRLGGCPDLGCIFPPDQYVIFQLRVIYSF